MSVLTLHAISVQDNSCLFWYAFRTVKIIIFVWYLFVKVKENVVFLDTGSWEKASFFTQNVRE